MSVHCQEIHGPDTARFYFYCLGCGYCGSLRITQAAADGDDRAHQGVCTAWKVAA